MQPFEYSVKVGNKRYEYTITAINKKEVFFECKAANISQRFAVQDIVPLLIDLPEIIETIRDFSNEYTSMVRLRVSGEEKKKIQQNARKNGYKTVSAFVRAIALKG